MPLPEKLPAPEPEMLPLLMPVPAMPLPEMLPISSLPDPLPLSTPLPKMLPEPETFPPESLTTARFV